ncbi:MAG: PilN domain-containing protein [Candidatus Saccharimonadales bacterium]
MIQFNLLPDVKMAYIKAQKMRRLILSIAVLVSVLSLALLGLVVVTNQLGKRHLADLSKDIASESRDLQGRKELNKILTVQNQLQTIGTLQDGRPAVSRLFGYLNQLTPSSVSITNYTSDLTAQSVTITGTADALSSVNKFVDTLKFTTFALPDDGPEVKTPAFKTVVLTTFSLGSSADKAQAASFTIDFSYDPSIFDITKKITLRIPSLVSTRSTTSLPTADLFTTAPAGATPSTGTTSGGSR